jgi:hypothetical protein
MRSKAEQGDPKCPDKKMYLFNQECHNVTTWFVWSSIATICVQWKPFFGDFDELPSAIQILFGLAFWNHLKTSLTKHMIVWGTIKILQSIHP